MQKTVDPLSCNFPPRHDNVISGNEAAGWVVINLSIVVNGFLYVGKERGKEVQW